jgi:hypothetical protein
MILIAATTVLAVLAARETAPKLGSRRPTFALAPDAQVSGTPTPGLATQGE